MKISENKKFIFCHIPRTAGRCTTSHLKPYTDKHWGTHRPFLNLKRCNPSILNYDFKQYFKFCFVRNPWPRVVSAYKYFSARNYYCDFETFVKNFIEITERGMKKHTHVGRWHVDSYWRFLVDENDNILADHIGKFETLHTDMKYISTKINTDVTLPVNLSKPKGYQEYWTYYNKPIQDIVSKVYEKEIEYFNYSFGDISSKWEVK